MTSECYGSFSAAPRSPCSKCAQRGPCSVATSEGKAFTVLPFPRYARDVVRYVPAMASPSAEADDTVAAIIGKLEADGYRATVRSIQIAGHTLVRFRPWIGSRVRMEFPSVSVHRMCEMPGAERVDVRPLLAKAPKLTAKITVAQLRAHAQVRAMGCVVLCSQPEDAVRIIKEVAQRIFSGGH